ncbi:MAG: hypothetical protein IKT57_03015 [Clostridia bacterium]|nr:hypothetical protein [Clostridia bacterium]
MINTDAAVQAFCRENDISIFLSHDMPAGYEDAYGTYDVTVNTLFLNTALLQDAQEEELLFTLYHELRHAVQYLHPERFDERIQTSRFYVILFDGRCFKLNGNAWLSCQLEGTEDMFSSAYLSLPYELDANRYACEKVQSLCGATPLLKELCAFWLPEETVRSEEMEKLFARIDAALNIPENTGNQ